MSSHKIIEEIRRARNEERGVELTPSKTMQLAAILDLSLAGLIAKLADGVNSEVWDSQA